MHLEGPGAFSHLTSRAEVKVNGRSAARMSGLFVSRSYRALAILVSTSEGFCLDGLLGAILFSAALDMTAGDVID